ncbi:MAG TPA: rod shape-determining protein RodA [Nitrospirales bacterium]|jgi:rod shape determining protein RodA|nr:rod shape-determining protein RodA [Nitrospirales bacterium]
MIDARTPDSFEWRFVLVAMGILAVGVLSIYSVSAGLTPSGQTPLYAKQMAWILIGTLAFLTAAAIDYHKLARHAYVLYGAMLLLLALVLVMGRSTRGAQRWFALGPFAFQPSEVAKLVLVLVLAKYFADVQRSGWIQRVIVPGLLTLPGLILILKQPDLGTAMSFSFIFVAMVLVGGLHTKSLGMGILFTSMLFPFAWELIWTSLHDYQRERIMNFWDPMTDPAGKGYHALQARIAIGSGGLLGKGLDEATQSRLKFLPEGHTDFVFAVFAEQWGFIGVLVLLALFAILIFLAAEIAFKAKDPLGLLLAAGLLSMLGFCLMVNVGMTMGIFPIVGIPLPLMSYGGTTTVTSMAALGLLLNVKRRRLTLFY